jgi:hypothetical protein
MLASEALDSMLRNEIAGPSLNSGVLGAIRAGTRDVTPIRIPLAKVAV